MKTTQVSTEVHTYIIMHTDRRQANTSQHTCSSENPLHACVSIQMPSWVPGDLAAKGNLTGNSIYGAIPGPIYTKPTLTWCAKPMSRLGPLLFLSTFLHSRPQQVPF